jgi:hypothetical protein
MSFGTGSRVNFFLEIIEKKRKFEDDEMACLLI